jgi:hypothetical protein
MTNPTDPKPSEPPKDYCEKHERYHFSCPECDPNYYKRRHLKPKPPPPSELARRIAEAVYARYSRRFVWDMDVLAGVVSTSGLADLEAELQTEKIDNDAEVSLLQAEVADLEARLEAVERCYDASVIREGRLLRERDEARGALRLKMIQATDWESTAIGERVNRQCGVCLYRWHYERPERHAGDCTCRLATTPEEKE